MDWLSSLGTAILDHIFIPILIAIGAGLLLIFKNRFDKFAKGIVARNELSDMAKKNDVRMELMELIEKSVESAVGANMQLADALKAGGRKLSEDEITSLNTKAKQLVINSLPLSLTDKDGVLLEIIGGKERLDAIIDSMMEKYVYMYKLEKMKAQAQVRAEVQEQLNAREQVAPEEVRTPRRIRPASGREEEEIPTRPIRK